MSGTDNTNMLFLQKRVAFARDEQAYKELFFHFYTKLHKLCLRIIRNPEAAEEIVSDVMIKIWQMEERLAEVSSLELYLLRSIKNASLNYLQKPRPNFLTMGDENLVSEGNFYPDDKVILTDTTRRIEEIVVSLPPQCQTVFRLVKEEGLTYAEVKEIMGISQNTIKTHMRIALRNIREALTISE